jgi:formylglycine-generating enzyme required for sulfatase activity
MGTWSAPFPCATHTCTNGSCSGSTTTGTSCEAGTTTTECGPNANESCCTSLEVPGGTYFRTYDAVSDGGVTLAPDGGPAGLADPATVNGFRLDKYLVTVGRFRPFVAAALSGGGLAIAPGAGKHAHLNGGAGLALAGTNPTMYESGWSPTDASNIDPTASALQGSNFATWTDTPGVNETKPINFANWYEAYAFCIWDGGFLPSEAEWGYAAAGGADQREFPWGSTPPGTDNQYAIYGFNYPVPGGGTGSGDIAPVGTATLGAGRWGQLDLAGGIWEFTQDGFDAVYADPCVNCTVPAPGLKPSLRGGAYDFGINDLVTSYRGSDTPYGMFTGTTVRYYDIGFRCARTP